MSEYRASGWVSFRVETTFDDDGETDLTDQAYDALQSASGIASWDVESIEFIEYSKSTKPQPDLNHD